MTPVLLAPWNTMERPAAEYMLQANEERVGHVLPVASLHEFEETPIGLRHSPSASTPTHVATVVVAQDKAKAENLEDVILVHHAKVRSLCDDSGATFGVEAMCSLEDMFAYNMGDGKPRYMVGQVRFDGEKRIYACLL